MNKKVSSLDIFLKNISFEKSEWYDYGFNYIAYLNYNAGDTEYRIPIKLTSNEPESYKRIKNGDVSVFDQIFSIGNEKYYEFLSKELTFEVKCQWLNLVNDVAFNIELLDEMKFGLPAGSVESFLRGIDEDYIRNNLISLATQENYTFPSNKVSLELLNDEKENSSVFLDSTQFPNLPCNTYAIIGKNGSGKTRLLNNLVSNYLSKSNIGYYFDEQVKSLLFISFSPFDFRENSIYEERNGFRFLGIPEITTRTSSILMDRLLPKMYSKYTYDVKKLYENIVKEYDPTYQSPSFLDLKKDISKKNELMNRYYNLYEDEHIYFRSINNDNILLLELQNIIFEYFNPIKDYERNLLFSILLDYFPVEEFAHTLLNIIDDCMITQYNLMKLIKLSSGQKILSISLLGLIMFSSNESVILIDEPETFLHPPMVKQYIQSINKISKEKNIICILTTHSPIVIQELPNTCVYSIKKGELIQFQTKTYGEDFASLYNTVYGLESSLNGYSNIVSRNKLTNNEVSSLGRNAYIDWLFENEKN